MAEITIEVDDDVLDDAVRVERETDHRGRLNLGTDYSDQTVEVLVLESNQTEESQAAD